MKVAIVGNGWVGKSMQDLFPRSVTYVRDVDKAKLESPNLIFSNDRNFINRADIAFICVPSPVVDEGRLDTSIVEECIAWLATPLIVVRSTVNPGDCDYWKKKYGKNIVFQPEYLGETPNHPLLDTKQTNFIILGGDKLWTRQLIELYQKVYNANVRIRQVTLKEAEIVKLTENRAISFRVAEAQELYDVCEAEGIDYYTIREAVYGDDPRMELWWTFVYPEKRGFNSKCIPKDIFAWCAWAESLGYDPQITRAILAKNKEWLNGREVEYVERRQFAQPTPNN